MSTLQNVSTTSARRIRGQGMTEYIIVVALIAIAAVAAVSYFGSAVQAQFANLGDELMGVQGANAAGTKPTATAKDLATYVN